MRNRPSLGMFFWLFVATTPAWAQSSENPAPATALEAAKVNVSAPADTLEPANGTVPAPAAALESAKVNVSAPAAALESAKVNVPVATAVEQVTLDQAIERALRRNPSAQAAALELDRAEALVREARATSLPSLTANATYTRLDSDRTLGGRIIAGKNQFNANLVLSVPLFAPGKWTQWSHAKDDARVVRMSGSEVRRQLAISVARTFLTVVSQRRVVEVNERALVTAIEHERYASERLAGGIGRRIDAVRASQQASTTQANVERARLALTRTKEALGVLLGAEHPVDVAVDPVLDIAPEFETATRESEQRPDVQVARMKRVAAERKFRDSWVDFLPQLVGQFQPFYQTPASLTFPTTGWQAMLLLTVPLYDGGLRYGARDERRTLRDQADLAVAGLMRQARSEVRMAYEAQKSAEAALAAATRASKMAHDAEQMANLAYQAGASTNLEVIDAERQARDADTDVAVAEDALRQARLDLLIASGRFPAKG